MSRDGQEFFDPLRRLAWSPLDGVEGLSEMTLSLDDASGDCTRLVRFDPGVDTSRSGTLRHAFWEEAWIVSGSIHDLGHGRTFSAGTYACRPPGLPHGPWRSPDGCVVFEVRYTLPRRVDRRG